MMRLPIVDEGVSLQRHPRSFTRYALCLVIGLNVASVLATLVAA